ncbi:MAG: phosphoribosylformylglycinamidine synthase subunit PurQ [Ignavibacteriales bacterium]|nr:phosphoribosylformylglycinamidine synthase subunit PurQ [Ignavibacteriales bacterium]
MHIILYAKFLTMMLNFSGIKTPILKQSSVILLPGGFSYGDYLRTGAIARFSPIMNSVISFANKGGIVIGICNGFQILLEAGLLPGVMIRNNSLKFACKDVYLKTENRETIFSAEISEATKALKIPIAHGEGNYFADIELLKELEANRQILFRYSDEDGNVNDENNPNGSQLNIAGIVNKNGNVMGMMPHPERACDPTLGRTDGQQIFKSIANYILN